MTRFKTLITSIFQYDESVLADLYFTDFELPVISLNN